MGRKIPGKKHRGVKDPEKQRNKRLNSLKGKVNAPPPNPDFQEVPHSVSRIAQLKEQIKNRKAIKNQNQEPRVAQPRNNLQRKPKPKKKNVAFEQLKGESDKHFMHRVHRACDSVLQEKAFENKYGVDIKRNPNTGEVEKLVKRPKDEIEQLLKTMKKTKNKKLKKGATTNEPVLTKSQKRQKKLKERKQRKLGIVDFEPSKDVVKFGETVHEPPSLSAPRRVSKLGSAPRPGERNLLLKTVIQEDKSSKNNKQKLSKSEQIIKKTVNKVIDKSGKRKNLPNALRRRLEKQQTEIINAYRNLKKNRVPTIST